MPLVLVQNPVIVDEGYDWKDIEGEQYHFPNQYKNRCVRGAPFIYYRGTRRPGGKRAGPEYFGYGRVGDVWRDDSIPEDKPRKDWAWYCGIEDYTRFPEPVPAKIDGEFLERIARNHWSVGVRSLPEETFARILQLAGCSPSEAGTQRGALPDLKQVMVTESDNALLIPRKPALDTGPQAGSTSSRHSKTARLIGRRAEEVAREFILRNASEWGAKNIRWVADEGLTPGWDIQYEGASGELAVVEVKGSAAERFANIELTAGEWKAAQTHGARYWLFLVADCCGKNPKIQRLENPAALVASGGAQIDPIVFRFTAVAGA